MNPEDQSNQTPQSVADAIGVINSAQGAQPVTSDMPGDEPALEVKAGEVPKKSKNPFKNKKILIPTIIVLLLLIGGSAWLFTRGGNKDDTTQASLAGPLGVIISLLDGQASSSSDGETWKDLTVRSQIGEGDFIRTGAGSRLVLALDDGSALRLDGSTTVKLASLEADGVRIEQRTGRVYSRLVESNRKYEIVVEDKIYTALGTAFETTRTADEKGLRVLQSSVVFDEITVVEGKQFYDVHKDAAYVQKITDIQASDLKTDSFLLWNLEQDESDSKFRGHLGYWTKFKLEQQPTEADPAGAKLELSAINGSKGVDLTWVATSVVAPDGFKIVRSQSNVLPAFGRDEAVHVSSPRARNHTWPSSKTGIYHYRICVYKASDSTCSVYSNTVTLEVTNKRPEAVVPGSVNLSISDDIINWTFEGTAPHGFKVLVSDQPGPTYPDHVEDLGAAPYTLKTKPSGTYYVRVCKYTGDESIDGGCRDYSNEVIWNN